MRGWFHFVRHFISTVALFVAVPVHADIATVGGVNKYITERWDITLPQAADKTNVMDMSYLMAMVDGANTMLNGTQTSDYAHDPQYANTNIASVDIATFAVDNLIRQLEMQFYVVPETSGTTFKINIAAGGTFYIAWGDGNVERWDKNVGAADISHTFPTGANNYKVYIGGDVTGYPTVDNGAIYFGHDAARKVREVGGCLGCVFHTVGDGNAESQQPKFHQTFSDNLQLKTIPPGFFFGVRGSNGRRMFYQAFRGSGLESLPHNLFMGNSLAPAREMFMETFYGCANLTGTIPGNLFSGLVGAPAEFMFDNTFHDCKRLGGAIPQNLFGGISGPVAAKMYNGTFYGCSGLTGEIPSGLFGDVYGVAKSNMFEMTFSGCSGLTSIADGFIGDVYGPSQPQMFDGTFYGCSSLTGPSATVGTGDNKEYLYERWPNANGREANTCYAGANGLTDYDCIPENWGGPGLKEPGTCNGDDAE